MIAGPSRAIPAAKLALQHTRGMSQEQIAAMASALSMLEELGSVAPGDDAAAAT